MSNKPILPNAYVDVNNRNLGLAPGSVSGIFAFIGVGVDAPTKDAILSIGGPNEAKTLLGNGEALNAVLDFFDNGGKKALAIAIDETTSAVVGAVSKVAAGTSTGTITLAADAGEKITDVFAIKVVITKTGDLGVAKFKVSTDNGENYGPEIIIPSGGTYVIPSTNLEITFVKGAGPIYFELDDAHTSAITGPLPQTSDINTAVDTLIASDNDFDAIVVVSVVDAALGATLQAKIIAAEASPSWRYAYIMINGALSADAAAAVTGAVTMRASVENDRMQIVTGEAVCSRPAYNDQADRNVIGIIAGRRSALNLQNDLGRFDVGPLANVLSLRTGWTLTTLEDLDGLQTVTIRQFKGTAGYRPTNGPMTDPFSDLKKDAWRLVLDKASRISRVTALGFLKIEVDPADIEGSTASLKAAIESNLNGSIVGNGEAVAFTVTIPEGQDILTTETLLIKIDANVYGHASWIGIEIGIVNPYSAS